VNTRTQAELALAVALAAGLSFYKIKLPHLLYGGSVSLHALPILVAAFRHGWRGGLAAGAVYGGVNFVITPYYVHPAQVLLDYPLAYASVGLAGLAARGPGAVGEPLSRWRILSGLALGMGARFAAHFLSGVVFFSQFAPEGQPAWLYSLLYNASYVIPEFIIYILLLQLILRRILLYGR
jgi:thiamine transporter